MLTQMIPRKVTVPKDDYKIFKANYPSHGSWSWFVRECLRRFNDLHMGNTGELLDETVKGLKEEVHDGDISDDPGYGSPLQSETRRESKAG